MIGSDCGNTNSHIMMAASLYIFLDVAWMSLCLADFWLGGGASLILLMMTLSTFDTLNRVKAQFNYRRLQSEIRYIKPVTLYRLQGVLAYCISTAVPTRDIC